MKNVALGKKVLAQLPHFLEVRLGQSQRLIVDGEVWEDSLGYKSAHAERMSACFGGTSLSKIAKLTLRELSAHFEQITLDISNWEFSWINVRMDQTDDEGHVPLLCEVYWKFENWANTYTIADLAQSIQDVLAEHRELPLKYWVRHDDIVEGLGVQGAARLEDTIEHVLLLFGKHMLDLSKLVETHIEERQRREFQDYLGEAPPPHKVSVLFRFPAAVKSACEQYLLYFGQFLSDLGILAETELTEKAARVLFSVTPNDATHALTQIRDALDTYLRLPFLPEFPATADQFRDPAVAQLRANVLHLQSQIVLAKSILQLKDATIQAKDAEIELLKGTIDLRGYVARSRKSHEESSSEPLITGVVSVKKYTLKFLEFDFPAILRKLKRRFS